MSSEAKNERIGEWKNPKETPMIMVLPARISRHAANALMPIFSLEGNGMARVCSGACRRDRRERIMMQKLREVRSLTLCTAG